MAHVNTFELARGDFDWKTEFLREPTSLFHLQVRAMTGALCNLAGTSWINTPNAFFNIPEESIVQLIKIAHFSEEFYLTKYTLIIESNFFHLYGLEIAQKIIHQLKNKFTNYLNSGNKGKILESASLILKVMSVYPSLFDQELSIQASNAIVQILQDDSERHLAYRISAIKDFDNLPLSFLTQYSETICQYLDSISEDALLKIYFQFPLQARRYFLSKLSRLMQAISNADPTRLDLFQLEEDEWTDELVTSVSESLKSYIQKYFLLSQDHMPNESHGLLIDFWRMLPSKVKIAMTQQLACLYNELLTKYPLETCDENLKNMFLFLFIISHPEEKDPDQLVTHVVSCAQSKYLIENLSLISPLERLQLEQQVTNALAVAIDKRMWYEIDIFVQHLSRDEQEYYLKIIEDKLTCNPNAMYSLKSVKYFYPFLHLKLPSLVLEGEHKNYCINYFGDRTRQALEPRVFETANRAFQRLSKKMIAEIGNVNHRAGYMVALGYYFQNPNADLSFLLNTASTKEKMIGLTVGLQFILGKGSIWQNWSTEPNYNTACNKLKIALGRILSNSQFRQALTEHHFHPDNSSPTLNDFLSWAESLAEFVEVCSSKMNIMNQKDIFKKFLQFSPYSNFSAFMEYIENYPIVSNHITLRSLTERDSNLDSVIKAWNGNDAIMRAYHTHFLTYEGAYGADMAEKADEYQKLLDKIAKKPCLPPYSDDEIAIYLQPLLSRVQKGHENLVTQAYLNTHVELISPINGKYYLCQITHHPKHLFESASYSWINSCFGANSAYPELRHAILGTVGDPVVGALLLHEISIEETGSLQETANQLVVNEAGTHVGKVELTEPIARRYLYFGETVGGQPVLLCDKLIGKYSIFKYKFLSPDILLEKLDYVIRSYCLGISVHLKSEVLSVAKLSKRQKSDPPQFKIHAGPFGHMNDYVDNASIQLGIYAV